MLQKFVVSLLSLFAVTAVMLVHCFAAPNRNSERFPFLSFLVLTFTLHFRSQFPCVYSFIPFPPVIAVDEAEAFGVAEGPNLPSVPANTDALLRWTEHLPWNCSGGEVDER